MNARDLLAAATPRPWRISEQLGGDHFVCIYDGPDSAIEDVAIVDDDPAGRATAALIVAAGNEYEAHEDCADALRRLSPAVLHACGGEDALARLDAVRSVT